MNTLNVKNSSAVNRLNVDEAEGIAQVEFTNGKQYTYYDVAKQAIRELLFTSTPETSLGQWVNENLINTKRSYRLGFQDWSINYYLINMNYNTATKANLVQLLEIKDKDLERFDDLKEQQSILFWLLFIIAGLGFMF